LFHALETLERKEMKIRIESTSKIVTLVINGAEVPARVWQGETITDEGFVVPVQAFITRISPEIPQSHPAIERLTAAFERDLKRQTAPRPTVEAIPWLMIMN
jgi:hypothetical protein